MILAGPKQTAKDQTIAFVSPNKVVVEAGLSILGFKNAIAGPRESVARDQNFPADLGQWTSTYRHVGNIDLADLARGPTKFSDATSSFCHVGEINPPDVTHGPAKFGGATSSFCHVNKTRPADLEHGPPRHLAFVANLSHATSVGATPSLEGIA